MTSNGNPSATRLAGYINVKLALLGLAPVVSESDRALEEIVASLVAQYREKERLLDQHLCPSYQRIQSFSTIISRKCRCPSCRCALLS